MSSPRTLSAARRTQITYSEWNVPAQAGYVRRLDAGFEFGMRRWGLLICPWGPRTQKVVLDSQIAVITHWPNWIIIKFDGSDELMLNDRVLNDFNHSSAPYPILQGFDNDSSGTRERELHLRQRALGPVSWEHGRSGPMTTSSTNARRTQIALAVIVVSGIVLSLVNR